MCTALKLVLFYRDLDTMSWVAVWSDAIDKPLQRPLPLELGAAQEELGIPNALPYFKRMTYISESGAIFALDESGIPWVGIPDASEVRRCSAASVLPQQTHINLVFKKWILLEPSTRFSKFEDATSAWKQSSFLLHVPCASLSSNSSLLLTDGGKAFVIDRLDSRTLQQQWLQHTRRLTSSQSDLVTTPFYIAPVLDLVDVLLASVPDCATPVTPSEMLSFQSSPMKSTTRALKSDLDDLKAPTAFSITGTQVGAFCSEVLAELLRMADAGPLNVSMLYDFLTAMQKEYYREDRAPSLSATGQASDSASSCSNAANVNELLLETVDLSCSTNLSVCLTKPLSGDPSPPSPLTDTPCRKQVPHYPRLLSVPLSSDRGSVSDALDTPNTALSLPNIESASSSLYIPKEPLLGPPSTSSCTVCCIPNPSSTVKPFPKSLSSSDVGIVDSKLLFPSSELSSDTHSNSLASFPATSQSHLSSKCCLPKTNRGNQKHDWTAVRLPMGKLNGALNNSSSLCIGPHSWTPFSAPRIHQFFLDVLIALVMSSAILAVVEFLSFVAADSWLTQNMPEALPVVLSRLLSSVSTIAASATTSESCPPKLCRKLRCLHSSVVANVSHLGSVILCQNNITSTALDRSVIEFTTVEDPAFLRSAESLLTAFLFTHEKKSDLSKWLPSIITLQLETEVDLIPEYVGYLFWVQRNCTSALTQSSSSIVSLLPLVRSYSLVSAIDTFLHILQLPPSVYFAQDIYTAGQQLLYACLETQDPCPAELCLWKAMLVVVPWDPTTALPTLDFPPEWALRIFLLLSHHANSEEETQFIQTLTDYGDCYRRSYLLTTLLSHSGTASSMTQHNDQRICTAYSLMLPRLTLELGMIEHRIIESLDVLRNVFFRNLNSTSNDTSSRDSSLNKMHDGCQNVDITVLPILCRVLRALSDFFSFNVEHFPSEFVGSYMASLFVAISRVRELREEGVGRSLWSSCADMYFSNGQLLFEFQLSSLTEAVKRSMGTLHECSYSKNGATDLALLTRYKCQAIFLPAETFGAKRTLLTDALDAYSSYEQLTTLNQRLAKTAAVMAWQQVLQNKNRGQIFCGSQDIEGAAAEINGWPYHIINTFIHAEPQNQFSSTKPIVIQESALSGDYVGRKLNSEYPNSSTAGNLPYQEALDKPVCSVGHTSMNEGAASVDSREVISRALGENALRAAFEKAFSPSDGMQDTQHTEPCTTTVINDWKTQTLHRIPKPNTDSLDDPRSEADDSITVLATGITAVVSIDKLPTNETS